MKPLTDRVDGDRSDSCDFWQVSRAGSILANQACTVSARHIKDGVLRLQFNREVAFFARSIVHDVEQGKKSPEQGMRELESEQKSLLEQARDVAQKGVGVIAGALQFATGAGICYASFGTLCLVAGAPLIAHGANNVYEGDEICGRAARTLKGRYARDTMKLPKQWAVVSLKEIWRTEVQIY